MGNCSKCGSKIRILEQKHIIEDGDIYCSECYSEWKDEKIKKDEVKSKEDLKKALSKNCKWEYKLIQIISTNVNISSQEQLNELGKQGWELVSTTRTEGTPTSLIFILKREI